MFFRFGRYINKDGGGRRGGGGEGGGRGCWGSTFQPHIPVTKMQWPLPTHSPPSWLSLDTSVPGDVTERRTKNAGELVSLKPRPNRADF